jgi:hypothetical protein
MASGLRGQQHQRCEHEAVPWPIGHPASQNTASSAIANPPRAKVFNFPNSNGLELAKESVSATRLTLSALLVLPPPSVGAGGASGGIKFDIINLASRVAAPLAGGLFGKLGQPWRVISWKPVRVRMNPQAPRSAGWGAKIRRRNVRKRGLANLRPIKAIAGSI